MHRSDPAREQNRYRLLIRWHFAPRLVAYGVAAVVFAIFAGESEEARPLRVVLCLYCLAYPLAAQHWAARARDPRHALDRLFRADLFNGGVGVAGFGFAPMPSLYLVGVNLVNTVAFGGFRDLPRALLFFSLGAAAARLGFGPLPASDVPMADIAAVAGLVIYNVGLGAIVHRATRQLREATRALRQQTAALAEASRTDPLTGVRNRRDLPLWLAESGHQSVGYVLIDIDHFKAINDRHGHAAGDQVLADFAERLRRRFAGRARVLRWGGEEYLLAWPAASRELLRQELAAFLPEVCAAPVRLDEELSIPVQCSIGAVAADGATSWESALALADRALYRAKALGRGCAVLHGEEEPIRNGAAPALDRPGAAESGTERRPA
jgi:diguanylate cyclase (GGDEF)-like protein